MTMTIAGTVDTFDRAGFKSSLGAQLGVSPASIVLTVAAASVAVTAEITTTAASVQSTVAARATTLVVRARMATLDPAARTPCILCTRSPHLGAYRSTRDALPSRRVRSPTWQPCPPRSASPLRRPLRQ